MSLTNAEKSRRWREAHPNHYKSNPEASQKRRENLRRFREKHKDDPEYKAKEREYSARSRAKNPEKVKALIVEWRLNNPERIKEYAKEYREAHPEFNRIHYQRRKARKLGAEINDFTKEQWLQVLEDFNYCCAYCLQPSDNLQQEHMTPLSRGGNHTARNIVPSCSKCNYKKHTKTLLEFVPQIPTLGTKRGVPQERA